MTRVKTLLAAAFAAMVPLTQAQATCWSHEAAEAAAIREMETMLMVAALRCRLTGQDFLPAYNAFIASSREALASANVKLRTHFAGEGGLDAYDRYVTAIANRYGAGIEGLSCADMTSILAAAAAERGSYQGLARLAKAAGIAPGLAGGRCTVEIARR